MQGASVYLKTILWSSYQNENLWLFMKNANPPLPLLKGPTIHNLLTMEGDLILIVHRFSIETIGSAYFDKTIRGRQCFCNQNSKFPLPPCFKLWRVHKNDKWMLHFCLCMIEKPRCETHLNTAVDCRKYYGQMMLY